MPAVIDTPEYIHDIAMPAPLIERPQTRGARPGFWRRLAHGISKHLTSMPHEKQAPSCSPHRPFETSMDRFAREYPSLSVYALALI
jgi:hypothetical protein